MALVKVFSGSEILAQSFQSELEAIGISPVVKNNIQASRSTGFAPLGMAVEIFIDDEDMGKAAQIIEEFKREG
jgi:hypothetical protein